MHGSDLREKCRPHIMHVTQKELQSKHVLLQYKRKINASMLRTKEEISVHFPKGTHHDMRRCRQARSTEKPKISHHEPISAHQSNPPKHTGYGEKQLIGSYTFGLRRSNVWGRSLRPSSHHNKPPRSNLMLSKE